MGVETRSEEAGYHNAIKGLNRIGLGHIKRGTPLPLAAEYVPHPVGAHGGTGGNPHAIILAYLPITEPVEAQLAGILRADHAGPGRHGNGWVSAAQGPGDALVYQSLQIGHLPEPLIRQQVTGGTIPTDNNYALYRSHFTSLLFIFTAGCHNRLR